jgi:hypothetical protein
VCDLVQKELAFEKWMSFCICETLLSEEVIELRVVSICNNEFDLLILSPDLQLQKESRSDPLD